MNITCRVNSDVIIERYGKEYWELINESLCNHLSNQTEVSLSKQVQLCVEYDEYFQINAIDSRDRVFLFDIIDYSQSLGVINLAYAGTCK